MEPPTKLSHIYRPQNDPDPNRNDLQGIKEW